MFGDVVKDKLVRFYNYKALIQSLVGREKGDGYWVGVNVVAVARGVPNGRFFFDLFV